MAVSDSMGRASDVQTGPVESWWLDELDHAGREHLDPVYVDGYNRKAGFDPTEDIDALEALGLDSRSVVLDLGAGTGTFAVAVASRCRRVVAVDVSPAMTNAIRHRVTDLGLDNVTVVEAGFLTYEHEGGPADVIFTRNALHQLPDFWKAIALERMASNLRPGGVLRLRDLIFDFGAADANTRIREWLSGAVTDPATGWTAEELAEHVRGEFSTYSWLLDQILERTGFEVTDRFFRRSAYGTYTAIRG
jgi:ubiquinone/menaquinone biosynthesis C-methylase UbiE